MAFTELWLPGKPFYLVINRSRMSLSLCAQLPKKGPAGSGERQSTESIGKERKTLNFSERKSG